MLRSAREWSKRYKFWSCADVDIVPQKLSGETFCSRNGNYEESLGKIVISLASKTYKIDKKTISHILGACKCKPKFYGKRCQYMNECSDDRDCLNGGK